MSTPMLHTAPTLFSSSMNVTQFTQTAQEHARALQHQEEQNEPQEVTQ